MIRGADYAASFALPMMRKDAEHYRLGERSGLGQAEYSGVAEVLRKE